MGVVSNLVLNLWIVDFIVTLKLFNSICKDIVHAFVYFIPARNWGLSLENSFVMYLMNLNSLYDDVICFTTAVL